MRMPFAFTSPAASRAPFSIVRPRYGERENGALTTIVSSLRCVAFEVPPQPESVSRATQSRRTRRIKARASLEGAPAQVGGADALVGRDGVRRAVGDHAARVEHDDPVGEAADDAEVVLDDEQREPFRAQ